MNNKINNYDRNLTKEELLNELHVIAYNKCQELYNFARHNKISKKTLIKLLYINLDAIYKTVNKIDNTIPYPFDNPSTYTTNIEKYNISNFPSHLNNYKQEENLN